MGCLSLEPEEGSQFIGPLTAPPLWTRVSVRYVIDPWYPLGHPPSELETRAPDINLQRISGTRCIVMSYHLDVWDVCMVLIPKFWYLFEC